MPVAVELRPTIDRIWLERAESADPLTHAYALWDLERTPAVVRFTSALHGDQTVGYLLVWLGGGDRPIVHWFGPPNLTTTLLDAFPAPPLVAVVPLEVEPAVLRRFPRARSSGLKLMLREPGLLPTFPETVRRLGPEDRSELEELTRTHREPELAAYAGLDPQTDWAWGAFDGRRLVGVARAAVRLPRVWVLGGVFVEPARRGQGVGRALVTAVVEAAEHAGARAGLYVRDEPNVAARLYGALGFRQVGRRAWIDVEGPHRS